MKTFSVNGNMTVAIDKINFVRYFSKSPLDAPDDVVEWFVEVNFGLGGFSTTYPNEESAKQTYQQICGLMEECKQ